MKNFALRYSTLTLLSLFVTLLFTLPTPAAQHKKTFRAGASAIDITPQKFPVIVNAMFTERMATNAVDPLHARCLVLDDGATRVAIAVVDTCMMPRELIDQAKELTHRTTGIAIDRMLISATHTHSAPSAMGCLGSRADPEYAKFLPGRIAEGIERAAKNLAPARIGWTVTNDWEHTHNRRWIFRSDKIGTDPFGEKTVRANMHPGHQNPDAIGPSGPVDPGLSIVSIQSPEGRPIALLANYSMHYYESPLLSADYYGRFAQKIGPLLGATPGDPPFVGMMSQGTSGDQMWMDYGKPRKVIGYDAYAEEIARLVAAACRNLKYHDWAPLVMRETKLALGYRVPDEKRLAWARQIADGLQGRLPRTLPEVYALEQIYLHEKPATELKLQALRIGELGITAIPNEVFAITGLKIKAQSPLQPTFNIELANGAEGYIPPPEQHKLGGYTTWPARTAGLVPEAEPKIVETALTLLEQVSGKPRRKVIDTHGAYAKAVLASKPAAYWRLNEFNGPTAFDATKNKNIATYEDRIAFYLPGPQSPNFSGENALNRAAHFAGGHLRADLKNFGSRYSIEFWFWNGLPDRARGVTGQLFHFGRKDESLPRRVVANPGRARRPAEPSSLARAHSAHRGRFALPGRYHPVLASNRIGIDESGVVGDNLAIGGTNDATGRLLFHPADPATARLAGQNVIQPKTWNHVVLVRDRKRVAAYLNGHTEMAGDVESSTPAGVAQFFIGGRGDHAANFEGKIDEVALYDRVLSPKEIALHYQKSGTQPNHPFQPPNP